ncbi:MAG: porin family protein [Ectothiorhodospiraceae bacterium]|nr:porin family protein [Ectothiorhodospiraceae bacterium]MCH8504667.1 porin family protein [Ectothiorhodospiraceae bacterium]
MRTTCRGCKAAALSLAISACMMGGNAQAQLQEPERFYVGIDLQNWFFNPDGASRASDFGVRAKFGARVAQQIALEAHVATGGSDRIGGGAMVEPSYLLSGLVRGDLPISRYSSLYGVVGFSQLNYDIGNSSEREGSISFGIGGDFQVTNNTYLNVDYIRYISDSDFNFDALSLGARWAF